MVIEFPIGRDLAEILVDALEDEHKYGLPDGRGVDFARELRERFGMGEQPNMLVNRDGENKWSR